MEPGYFTLRRRGMRRLALAALVACLVFGATACTAGNDVGIKKAAALAPPGDTVGTSAHEPTSGVRGVVWGQAQWGQGPSACSAVGNPSMTEAGSLVSVPLLSTIVVCKPNGNGGLYGSVRVQVPAGRVPALSAELAAPDIVSTRPPSICPVDLLVSLAYALGQSSEGTWYVLHIPRDRHGCINGYQHVASELFGL
jgi:hypothetical protein